MEATDLLGVSVVASPRMSESWHPTAHDLLTLLLSLSDVP